MKAARFTNRFIRSFVPTAYSRGQLAASPYRGSVALQRGLLLVFLMFNFTFLIRGQTTIDFYLTQFTGATNDTIINIMARNIPIIYNGNFYWWPQNGASPAIGLQTETYGNTGDRQNETSQEFRITSPTGGPMDFTAGAYFFYQDLEGQSVTRSEERRVGKECVP